jgi:adenylate cyclase
MRIIYSYDGKETTVLTEKRRVVIGRSKPNVVVDLDLSPDKTVSRPHAIVLAEEGRYWIEDLNSTRGTLVNGGEIKGAGPRALEPGDVIQMGDTTLRLEPGDPEPKAVVVAEVADHGDITQTRDATAPLFAGHERPSEDMGRRLALLYDLPLQLGAEVSLDRVLQTIVERLLPAIPRAARAALLVQNKATSQLLLKAHVPAGTPAVSLRLAEQAMERRQGFVWRRGHNPDLTVTFDDHPIESALYVPLLWNEESLGVLCAVSYDAADPFSDDDLRLMLAVAQHAAMGVVQRVMQDDLRANANLMTRLMINFSPKVRDRLLTGARIGRPRLGGQKSDVTVLITDIRDFTRLSARMDAEDIVDMLNDYFSALVDVAYRFDGTVDKFIGDAMLVIFGSPEPDPQQHDNAVHAAVAMQAAIRTVTVARAARGQVTCDMGIGLHCGEVLHGFIGSNDRMEFTVIGDTVNRANAYCSAAGPGEILISQEVHQWVWRIVQSEPVTITTKHDGTVPALRVRGIRHVRE